MWETGTPALEQAVNQEHGPEPRHRRGRGLRVTACDRSAATVMSAAW